MGNWKETPIDTNTGVVLVKFDQLDPTPHRFHHFRTLFVSQYLPLFSGDNIHMGMLESLYSSTLYSSHLKEEETYFGPAPYHDLKHQAQSQRALWLTKVKTLHFLANFKESFNLTLLSEDPNWFGELANLANNPPHFQSVYGYSIFPSNNCRIFEGLKCKRHLIPPLTENLST